MRPCAREKPARSTEWRPAHLHGHHRLQDNPPSSTSELMSHRRSRPRAAAPREQSSAWGPNGKAARFLTDGRLVRLPRALPRRRCARMPRPSPPRGFVVLATAVILPVDRARVRELASSPTGFCPSPGRREPSPSASPRTDPVGLPGLVYAEGAPHLVPRPAWISAISGAGHLYDVSHAADRPDLRRPRRGRHVANFGSSDHLSCAEPGPAAARRPSAEQTCWMSHRDNTVSSPRRGSSPCVSTPRPSRRWSSVERASTDSSSSQSSKRPTAEELFPSSASWATICECERTG